METNNKLREALELAKSTFETLIQFQGDEHFVKCWATLARDAVIAALAEPVKNYEVGTPEEQYERYKRRCKAQDCRDCPVRGNFKRIGSESCQLVWAQMPYEEGGAK